MPNTKSAERRVRSSARKQQRNHSVRSSLKTLELGYQASLKSGNKAEASKRLIQIHSALDKAAKRGVVHWATVNRKKSRLATRLTALS